MAVPSHRPRPSLPDQKAVDRGCQQQNLDAHVVFLSTDAAVSRSDPDADPREPIPEVEADQVAIDSESLDAVAVSPPTAGVGYQPSVAAKASNGLTDYAVREADRLMGREADGLTGREADGLTGCEADGLTVRETDGLQALGGNSRDTGSPHIPGEYPKKS